ncbi:YjiH family protein [Corynebacterium sp. H128]|uniref:YjiH family protein n=1 Tax=unclassified Corynebacterium TaxID=2624378 RepID=UPI00309E893A
MSPQPHAKVQNHHPNANAIEHSILRSGTHAQHKPIWPFFLYSAIGIFVFFVPITWRGNNTIIVDHAVSALRAYAGSIVPWVLLALMSYGMIRQFVTGKWRNDALTMVFSFANIAGVIVSALYVTGTLKGFLNAKDLVPFLFEKIATPVGLIVPIGSMFLALIVCYGLLEFVGVLMQPVMRPIWRTPGRSAIDAVASFVGSYSLGILITDRVYREGKYTTREAAIIATGFSTVSAAFMVIVAKTLDIMQYWGQFFFVSLIVTFVVTAITVRIPPLSLFPDDYHKDAAPQPEEKITKGRFTSAWGEARETLDEAPPLPKAVWINFVDGTNMAAAITPSIMSVGLGGLLLAKFTPIFDWLGYLIYPFTWAARIPEPMVAAKASAVGIAEMLLPATLAADQPSLVLRFVIAVVAVSAIIFFSALVPCILATEIPVKVWQMVVIWFERVALTILLTAPIAHLLL